MTNLRVPKPDDAFLVANAGRMFELLCGVNHHPSGVPIIESTRREIENLFVEAYRDGIDTISVAETGLQP